jgi:hypothetical protein
MATKTNRRPANMNKVLAALKRSHLALRRARLNEESNHGPTVHAAEYGQAIADIEGAIASLDGTAKEGGEVLGYVLSLEDLMAHASKG